MVNIFLVISIMLIMIALSNAAKGLNLRKVKGWCYVLSGFLGGFLLISLSTKLDLLNRLGFGVIVGFLIMYMGFWHQRIYYWARKSKYYKNDLDKW